MNWVLIINHKVKEVLHLCNVFNLTFWFGLAFLETILHKLLHDLTRYLNEARAFLEECSTEKEDAHVASSGSKYQYINLLVTSGSLIPSLVKCLLFRLDSLITHGNGPPSTFSLFCLLILLVILLINNQLSWFWASELFSTWIPSWLFCRTENASGSLVW